MNKKLCSGFGRYHTDNPQNPKAQPFCTVDYAMGIVKMATQPPATAKQSAQWFIPSVVLTRSKSAQIQQGEFYCLVADIDHKPPTIKEVSEIITLACRGSEFLIYTSRSATINCQKSHVLIPTIKLTPYRWQLAQSVLNNKLEKAGITPDRKTEDHNQIIYLPNRGEYYAFIRNKGAVFNPLIAWYPELLKKHEAIEAVKQARLKKPVKPSTRPINPSHSIINEFNATFSVEELLIKAGYAQKGTCFRHPNSHTGNYSASVKNGKVFTLSSSDPLFSTYAHDAFNVFVVLFNDGNRKAAMLNAGDNWLSVEGMSWNKHQQKNYMERR